MTTTAALLQLLLYKLPHARLVLLAITACCIVRLQRPKKYFESLAALHPLAADIGKEQWFSGCVLRERMPQILWR
jgi:hypothetical protein